MKYNNHIIANFTAIIVLNLSNLYAQDSIKLCRVEMKSLIGTYSGECRNGYANGKGEAKGLDRYEGLFKNGLPNGKGIYYYNDSIYYSGNFQDGVKEGKGEIHYLRKGMSDSLLKGYWSADEYRGKKYITYSFTNNSLFDRVEINPSDNSGNILTISISGELILSELIATDGNFIRKLNTFASLNKHTVTYELSKFPIRLQAIFSNGQICNLELYKQANWKAEFFTYHLQQ